MDTVKHFLSNFKLYSSGEIEHREISSVTIKKILYECNLWRVPLRGESWWRISVGFIGFFLTFACVLSGYPRVSVITEWGKFIDVLAGIEMSFAKFCFIYWKRHELTDIFKTMNALSQELRTRGKNDRKIKKLRDYFYVQEMVVLLFTSIFGVTELSVDFVCVLIFTDPLQLVVPMQIEPNKILTGPSTEYWIAYASQWVLIPFVTLVITTCDVMLGNIYNQLILHLEVLQHDLRLLNGDKDVSTEDMIRKFCEFIKTYQSLQQLNKRFEKCLRPFFINNILGTVLVTTFTCVEMGIMVNVSWRECLKPLLYFLFTSFPFFYWCWLGNRVQEKSTELAHVAFIYKVQCSNSSIQKLQLLFTHMVQKPMSIMARPLITLNFDIFVTVMKVAYQFTAVFKNLNK